MQYPELKQNITSMNQHLDITALMNFYDKYTALGILLLPKTPNQKFPLAKYWKNHEQITREKAEADQHSTGYSGWCIVTGNASARLVALDFDTEAIRKSGNDPQQVFDGVQARSLSKFVIQTPSGGLHVLYRQPEGQTVLTNSKTPVVGLDKRGDGGQIASFGSFYRYTGKDATNKGVAEGHGGFYTEVADADYSFIPEMSDELYTWLLPTDKKATSESFVKSPTGEARVKKHFEQPTDAQERIVVSALASILHKWGKRSYDEWLQMWMSAHHASGGSITVRDFILAHDDIVWSGDQDQFRAAWAGHEYRDGGYTASSLFWLARQSGWLLTTGYELNRKLSESINVRYVGEWLATLKEVPQRLLLASQTGSGKTFSLKFLYEKLEHPKTVVFVPSIKLALELTATLVNRHGLPAVCYYSQDIGSSIDVKAMIEAPILVTTLQTFATKVRVPMSSYGLVYIEESDQLLAGFARGGGGQFSTHVSDREARLGFSTLRDAFMTSKVVWCVDATMSQVTYRTANEMSQRIPIRTVINDWVEPKAPVIMVDEIGRALQEVLRALGLGQKVVCVCDTAQQAAEVADIMDRLGALRDKQYLVITRETENDPFVHAFMEDVNGQAGKYDLVCYNSVMASGVSITDFTPDVVVQFCTYLTPRVNLQLLNRYRKQKVVYCYYRPTENLYSMSDEAILERVHEQVAIEGRMINMPIAVRNSDADLRDVIGAISIADQQAQDKAPRDFYMHLLQEDGREVTSSDATPVSEMIGRARKAANELRKLYKEELKSSWINTPPIARDEVIPKGYTDLQIAQGEIHEEIRQALRDNIPAGVDPKVIYDIVDEFRDFAIPLQSFIYTEWAVNKAEEYLADSGKALMSIRNNLTTVDLVNVVRLLYGTFDNPADTTRCGLFLKSVQREVYDSVITRKSQNFDVVMDKNETVEDKALALSKIILSKIGLKQRAVRVGQRGGATQYEYRIANLEECATFISWRSPELDVSKLRNPDMKSVYKRKLINKSLTQDQNGDIMALVTNNNGSYADAVAYVNQEKEM